MARRVALRLFKWLYGDFFSKSLRIVCPLGFCEMLVVCECFEKTATHAMYGSTQSALKTGGCVFKKSFYTCHI